MKALSKTNVMQTRELKIPTGEGVQLLGQLFAPPQAKGLIIISNGRSSRFNERSLQIAEILYKNQIATLLTDLIADEENEIPDKTNENDILVKRLIWVTTFAKYLREVNHRPIGYIGFGPGVPLALSAASKLQSTVRTVICNPGSTEIKDLAVDSLNLPCLLFVEHSEDEVVRSNKKFFSHLRGIKQVYINSFNIFQKGDKADKTAILTGDWLNRHLINDPIAPVFV